MKRFYVEQVKTAMKEPMGPFPPTITVEAKVKDGDEEYYVLVGEVEGGGAGLYKTEESCIQEFTFSDDEEVVEKMDKALIAGCDYSEVFSHTDWEWLPLFRYLVYILRADQNLFDSYNNRVVDKYVDEIDFPASDVEQENTPM